MVRKYRVKIPSAYYMILVKGLQFIGAAAVITLILFVAPAEHRVLTRAPSAPKPTANCYANYKINVNCKNEIDSYYAQTTDNSPYWYTSALLIIIAMIALEGFYITRWLWPYTKGVSKVTRGWSRSKVVALTLPGVLIPAPIKDTYPILLIQNSFNKL